MSLSCLSFSRNRDKQQELFVTDVRVQQCILMINAVRVPCRQGRVFIKRTFR